MKARRLAALTLLAVLLAAGLEIAGAWRGGAFLWPSVAVGLLCFAGLLGGLFLAAVGLLALAGQALAALDIGHDEL